MSSLLVVSRMDPRDDKIVEAAEACSFRVARLPLLATEPGRDVSRFLEWLEQPAEGTAIAWTSRRAAEALARTALPEHEAALAGFPLFAVGEESAAPIVDRHLDVEYVQLSPSAKNLGKLIAEARASRGLRRVAFLRGDRSLPDLPDILERAGIEVEPFELYRTTFQDIDVDTVRSAIAANDPIVVLYFSPSGVEALERLLPDVLELLRSRSHAVPIGATTRRALSTRGYASIADPGVDPFTPAAFQSVKRIPR
jgi:uroporphyrinogen-III synthase